MKKNLVLALFAMLVLSCGKHKPATVTRAFYFWKSNDYHLSEAESQVADTLKVAKMYVKFFEVDWNLAMGIFPTAKSDFRPYDKNSDREYVPTVFIRNDVFLKNGQKEIDIMADNVNFLIMKYARENYSNDSINEFQMDCDWTPKSRDNYFYFLRKIKAISKKKISCTLRLYPYKYQRKMGVPPVDRAMLMCYNLINPLVDQRKNSILDPDELSLYLTLKDEYPLPLDVALPVFSWLHIYKNNRFQKVINGTPKMLGNSVKPRKPLWFEVVKDTILDDGMFLRTGDRIKSEEVTAADLYKTQKMLLGKAHLGEDFTVSLFHLDETQLQNFTNDELEKFYTGFTAP